MRHSACKIFFAFAIYHVAICLSEEDDESSPDYSTIFQQFLLQKIKEGEPWSNLDYESQFPNRARQEKFDEIDNDDVDEDSDTQVNVATINIQIPKY